MALLSAEQNLTYHVRRRHFPVPEKSFDLGAELGIVKKSGSWFSYNATKLAQGRDAAKQVIADNPELAEELEGLIFEALRKDK